MSEQQNKKTGKLMIIGGIILAIITLGGVYLSQNPQILSDWKYKRDSARKDSMRDILLTAKPECNSVSTEMFVNACKLLESDSDTYDYQPLWANNLSEQEKSCALNSFRDTTLFKLEYDGDPASHLENMETPGAITLHLCSISEDIKSYFPEFQTDNAAELINKWHQWRNSEGNYYH